MSTTLCFSLVRVTMDSREETTSTRNSVSTYTVQLAYYTLIFKYILHEKLDIMLMYNFENFQGHLGNEFTGV